MKRTTVWCLVIAISVLAVTESSFFVGNLPPDGLPDTHRGIDRPIGAPATFFSLFDPDTNTPFYSAYKVLPVQAANIGKYPRPSGQKWKDPPSAPGLDKAYKLANEEAQRKYSGNKLTRGHMNPSGINSFEKTYMKNTFTLENAVPQFETSNSGDWQVYEKKISDYAKNICGNARQGTLYLLTGRSEYCLNGVTKPPMSTSFTVNHNKLDLHTPGAVWTAGCCVWKEPSGDKADSFAVISNNHYDKAKLYQKIMKVTDLENHLNPAATVTLFPGNKACARTHNPPQ